MAILRVKPVLQKPVVGGSINEWGDILNSNIDAQDNFNNSVLIDSEAKDSEIERLDREKISRTDVDTVVQTSVDEYINTNGKVNLDEHIEKVNKPELDKYTEEKKKDIDSVIRDLGSYNINTGSNYKTWIGSESDYQSLSVKENGVLYMTFDSLFNVVTKYFKPKLDIVKNGLVCWLDGRDGVNKNTTWKDRSGNGNDVVVKNLLYNKYSGWTGKTLRMDGIQNSFITLNNIITNIRKIGKKDITIISKFKKGTTGNLVNSGTSSADSPLSRISSPDGTSLRVGNSGITHSINTDYYYILFSTEFTNSKCYDENSKNIVAGNFGITSSNNFTIGALSTPGGTKGSFNGELCSIIIYDKILTEEEIKQNFEYEQSINRSIPETLDEKIEEEIYCIGNTTDLSEKQKEIFRLSNDKTKFVSSINNIGDISVLRYTYEEIQKIMETPEWRSEEENTISDNMVKNINGEWR